MKKKILQFSVRDNMGGQTQYILNTWKCIDRDRFQFDFVTFAKKLRYENELTEQGCKIHYMTVFAEENRELFIRELDAILAEGYDAIHIHTPHWKSTLVEERAKIARIPQIIIHAHSAGLGMTDSDEMKRELQQHCKVREELDESMADIFCACSEKAAEWLYGDKLDKKDILILKNAIDVEKFAFNESIRKQYRNEFGINDKFVIGHVGRYVYAKNHDFIIDFYAGLVKHVDDAMLILIGNGPEKERIHKKIKSMGLSEKILCLENRKDIAQLMQMMDIFVLPSNYEGFPIVLTEAQAADLPCLVSENVTTECNIIGNVGFLPLERNLWVEKVKALADDRRERQNRTEQLLQAGYDLKDVAKVVEELYEKQGN